MPKDKFNSKFNKTVTSKREKRKKPKNEIIDNSIKIPFPPLITINDLIAKTSPHDNNPGRTPNAFIAYKMGIHRVLRNEKYNYSIPAISKFASYNWANEPPQVKKYYKKLANDAKKIYEKSRPIFISMDRKFKNSQTTTFSSNFSENSLSPELSPSLLTQSQQSNSNSNSNSQSASFLNYNNFSNSLFGSQNTTFDLLTTPLYSSSSTSYSSPSSSSVELSQIFCSDSSEIIPEPIFETTYYPSSLSLLHNQALFNPEDYYYEGIFPPITATNTNINFLPLGITEISNGNNYNYLEKRIELLEQRILN
ncbi:hypothetical protein Glove_187g115 [Diversispora epigaea]|uniref:HMG box domain-containing protein n=1 Tax=Diversispora epigaea TaxID=1348612 RepID=A0A397ILW7_9GLOM|nr:hypothetical protein Glove_187g115 [Diversispora epigaea]